MFDITKEELDADDGGISEEHSKTGEEKKVPPFSTPTYTTTFFFTLLMPGFPINDLPMSYISSSLTTSFPFTTSTM